MPSSKGYIRDYKQEARVERPQRKHQRVLRVPAERAMQKALGHQIPPGMDVDHRVPLSQGGSNKPSNLRLRKASVNRSYARTSSGAIKSKTY